MKFDIETDESGWTLDNSIPLRIYSNEDEEYILEVPLNYKELKSLRKEVELAIRLLEKSGRRRE